MSVDYVKEIWFTH